MTTELATQMSAALVERVVIGGDLSKLTSAERLQYYNAVCASVGLNPLTKPFEYISLQGKLTLYARRDATDQLRDKKQVSVAIKARELVDGIYVVTASAKRGDRVDESIGAVNIEGLKGEAKANAMMKAETKAKRRVTLSICGLGMLDETEVETVPGARKVKNMGRAEVVDPDTGEVHNEQPQQAAQASTGVPPSIPSPPPAAAPAYISADQAIHLEDRCKEIGLTKEALCKAAKVERISQIERDDYGRATAWLDKQHERISDRAQA